MGWKKRGQAVTPGYAWCTKGDHEAPAELFYKRKDGTLRTWCVDCSRKYTKDNFYVRRVMSNPKVEEAIKYLMDAAADDAEKELVEEQKKNRWTAPPYEMLVLDWLTPLYVHGPRPGEDEIIYLEPED